VIDYITPLDGILKFLALPQRFRVDKKPPGKMCSSSAPSFLPSSSQFQWPCLLGVIAVCTAGVIYAMFAPSLRGHLPRLSRLMILNGWRRCWSGRLERSIDEAGGFRGHETDDVIILSRGGVLSKWYIDFDFCFASLATLYFAKIYDLQATA